MRAASWALAALLTSGMAHAQEDDPAQAFEPATERLAEREASSEDLAAWQREGLGWGAVPNIRYNSDIGFVFGVVGDLYGYDGKTSPFKWRLGLLVDISTQGVHNNYIEADLLDVGGMPLRIKARVGYAVTRTGNFCGFGRDVTCDPADAVQAATEAGLTGEARDEFVGRYYKMRFLRPYGNILARWEVVPDVEIFGQWRGEYHAPGDFQATTPFPGSLYAQVFPEGEKGFLSVLQGGVLWDRRDFETAPRKGFLLEGSVRGSTAAWGSAWTWFGVTTTFLGFVPLDRPERLVWANRVVFDGIVGDPPTREYGNTGGTTMVEVYGSSTSARGIRARRYLGRARAFSNHELRWTFWRFRLFGMPFSLGAVGFVDLGVIAHEWADFGRNFARPLWGTGGGVRFSWDDNFVIRADVGVSPVEEYSPGVYIAVGHVF